MISNTRTRNFILLLIVFGFILWFIIPKCEVSEKILPSTTSCPIIPTTTTVDLPTIYAITPTYYRPTQKAELTRLSHCLMLVPNVFWILVEDATNTSELVRGIRNRSGLYDRSVQLIGKTPEEQKPKKGERRTSKSRGVIQRNAGLDFAIRRMTEKGDHSIVFFMDDDNTYSVELFHEMSKIEKGRVGVWPVGLVGGMRVEKPIVDENGNITGFNAMWKPERNFPIDMAAFGISGDLFLKNPEARFSYEAAGHYLESNILEQVTTREKLQPLANMCRDIWVWHTRTEKPPFNEEAKYLKKFKVQSDRGMEL